MELDKFQQFVKDGKYDANLSHAEIFKFIKSLDQDSASDLMESIELSLDLSEIVSNAVYEISNQAEFYSAIKSCTIEAIKGALADIKEVEDLNRPTGEEDCCDAHKREQELSQ